MPYRSIARVIPTIQAAGLVGHNVKYIKKKDLDATDFVKLGTTNVVGTSMIKVNADLIAGL